MAFGSSLAGRKVEPGTHACYHTVGVERSEWGPKLRRAHDALANLANGPSPIKGRAPSLKLEAPVARRSS
eukprot:2046188-Prymnesium_polylepis.2